MAGSVPGDTSQLAVTETVILRLKLEERDNSSYIWYFSRDDIERRSPSRMDSIDLKKETYLRKSYCTFLQDLGMRLEMPQVTIATAIVFCHRFFLRQSHLKNDRYIIATICMFLAGKVEETPRSLRDVILMSYEIRHIKDPVAVARIKQKDTYGEQKDLVLVGERLVLITLGFDLNILHPYKPLVEAIKKLKVAQNALVQVAWNFVNDGLRTSLCLQFKPHHIAAGAIFLAAKFLKVRLPSDGENVWWKEFGVTPWQLEEVSNQMLELYDHNKSCGVNASRSSDPIPSTGMANHFKALDSAPSSIGNHGSQNSSNAAGTDHNKSGIANTSRLNNPGPTLGIATGASAGVANRINGLDAETSSKGNQESRHSPIAAFLEKIERKLGDASASGASNPGGSTGMATGESTGVANCITGLESMPSSKGNHGSTNSSNEAGIDKSEHGQIADLDDAGYSRREEVTGSYTPPHANGRLEDSLLATEHDGSFNGDRHFPRELTEAKSSLEERELEDVVDSKRCLEVRRESASMKSCSTSMDDEIPEKLLVTSMGDLNKNKVRALVQKRRKLKGEGFDSKPAALKMELADEEELLEWELENGVKAAAEAEREKQVRIEVKLKSSQKVENCPVGKKECTEDGESGLKRKRYKEKLEASEKKWTEADRVDAAGVRNRVSDWKDGEPSRSSLAHGQAWSPHRSDRRPVPFSGSHQSDDSPIYSRRHRDSHAWPHFHRDSRISHGSWERDYHQSDHHQQHRTDEDRDRHYHKERLSRVRS